jgi:hypothetical protein
MTNNSKECKSPKISQSYQWNLNHPEQFKLNKQRYYQRHKQKILDALKLKRLENPLKFRDRENNYNINNRKKRSDYQKQYKKNHPDKIRKWSLDYAKRKRAINDPKFIIMDRLRARLRDALKVKGVRKHYKTLDLLGCTAIFLQQYLESKFYPHPKTGEMMTWNNRKKWHIDHIIPCESFNLSDPEQQKQCFNYTNLQPLWAEYNLAKGSKLL